MVVTDNMDTAGRIKDKEYLMNMYKDLRTISYDCGQIELGKETEDRIKDLENSIEHDRKVQLEEAKVSGRKEWYHDFWKYVLLFIVGAVFIEIVKVLLSKI